MNFKNIHKSIYLLKKTEKKTKENHAPFSTKKHKNNFNIILN